MGTSVNNNSTLANSIFTFMITSTLPNFKEDNNAVNSKAMCNFSATKKLSIVDPHPTDINRPLMYLFDSVH